MSLQQETQKLIDLYIKAVDERSITFDYKETYQHIVRNVQMLPSPSQEMLDFLSDYTIEDAEQLRKTADSDMVLIKKTNNAINEFMQNLQALNYKYDFRKAYKEIDSLVKEQKHPTPEMSNFIEQVRRKIEQQIHDSIFSFQQNAQKPGYNYQKEYLKIYLFIKQLREPTQEMLDFVDNKMLEKCIESKIKEFNTNLYKLSNEFDFFGEYTEICDLIKQINNQTTWMLDFMRIDINKIFGQQVSRKKLQHRFSKRKYIPSRKWEEWESKYTQAVEFSKQLINYKNYSLNRIANQGAFDEINKIFFKQLTDIVHNLRDVFGYDINIVLCACPSSNPDKKNTVQLSIAEYAKTNKNVIDANDLFLKVHPTEPAHISGKRDLATVAASIKINSQKYTKEFFDRRNIFIICDDVYTTGTTMNACKCHLRPKQVIDDSIFVYTIAETLDFQW